MSEIRPCVVIFTADVCRFGTWVQWASQRFVFGSICGGLSNAVMYGYRASGTTPRCLICSRQASAFQPAQLAPWDEQKWESASDRSRSWPFSIEAIDSTRAVQQNDTQEPQYR